MGRRMPQPLSSSSLPFNFISRITSPTLKQPTYNGLDLHQPLDLSFWLITWPLHFQSLRLPSLLSCWLAVRLGCHPLIFLASHRCFSIRHWWPLGIRMMGDTQIPPELNNAKKLYSNNTSTSNSHHLSRLSPITLNNGIWSFGLLISDPSWKAFINCLSSETGLSNQKPFNLTSHAQLTLHCGASPSFIASTPVYWFLYVPNCAAIDVYRPWIHIWWLPNYIYGRSYSSACAQDTTMNP